VVLNKLQKPFGANSFILTVKEIIRKCDLKKEISEINRPIELAIVLVGNNPASLAYTKRKQKIGEELGIKVKIYKYEENISTRKLREEINKLNKNKKIKGIIAQLPLPNHINTESMLDAIKAKKDIDVLGRESVGRLYKNKSKILPPTVAGIKKLLDEYKIEYKGKNVAIVGYGSLVGKPASMVFANEGASIFVLRSSTKNKNKLLREADIIISGVGKPNLITKKDVKKGVIIMDAGMSEQNGKLVGDVADEVKKIAKYITPVPGGVGPMTVAMLFWNLLELVKNRS